MMYWCGEFIRKDSEYEDILSEAEKALEVGDSRTAHSLLSPLIEKNVADAMYIAACISKYRETEEAFYKRRLWLLNEAAMLDHPHSIYVIGVGYATGVGRMKNHLMGAACFERAASLGHHISKLHHGLNLVQGYDFLPKDKEAGLDFLRQAVAEGVEDADSVLEKVLAGEFD